MDQVDRQILDGIRQELREITLVLTRMADMMSEDRNKDCAHLPPYAVEDLTCPAPIAPEPPPPVPIKYAIGDMYAPEARLWRTPPTTDLDAVKDMDPIVRLGRTRSTYYIHALRPDGSTSVEYEWNEEKCRWMRINMEGGA